MSHRITVLLFLLIASLSLYRTQARNLYYAVAPQILQFAFGDDPLNSGEMLSVTCTIVKGDFPVKLTWSFNGQPIDPSQSDINIVNDKRVSFLSIDNVAARHAGNYTCTATNAAGSDSHVAVLKVNGRAFNEVFFKFWGLYTLKSFILCL